MSLEDEFKFLHDIANSMSIVQGNLKIAVQKMENSAELAQTAPAIAARLAKALAALEVMITLLTDRRGVLGAAVSKEDNLSSRK